MRRSRGNPLIFVLVLLAGLAAFGALWYQASRGGEGNEPAFGGVYVEGMAGSPSRVNPLFAGQNAVDESLVALVFSGLTRLDTEGRAVPDLAETWSVSPDGLVYTITLRPNLQWQDGAPLTAEDVVFTYSLLNANGVRASHQLATVLIGATTTRVDDRTLRIELPRPFAPLPSYLTLGILPVHILGNISPRALVDEFFNQQPIGSGPYRLAELTPDHAILEVNPAYHLGQPFVQRLELRFYRHEGLLLTALKAGKIDGAYFSGGIGPAELQELQQHAELRLDSLPTGETTYVYLNLKLSIFQDRRVRQALLYALDRDAIVEEVFDGQALRADSPISAGSWAYSDALARYDPDQNVAASLLSEAGWLTGPDGIRRRGSAELAFTLAVNNDPVRVTVANQIAERWSAVGVRVTVEATGATGLVRELLEPRIFEAVLFANVLHDDPDPYLAWHSSQTGQRGANLSSLRDDRIDRALDEARLLATPERRAALYSEFQEIFAQEVPAIPLYTSTVLYAQEGRLKGVRIGYLDNPGARFWQVQEWHLRTR